MIPLLVGAVKELHAMKAQYASLLMAPSGNNTYQSVYSSGNLYSELGSEGVTIGTDNITTSLGGTCL